MLNVNSSSADDRDYVTGSAVFIVISLALPPYRVNWIRHSGFSASLLGSAVLGNFPIGPRLIYITRHVLS